METKIQKLGQIDNVKLFYDPLRKEDSFIVMKHGESKLGFVIANNIIFESGFNYRWNEVTGIMGGFSSTETYDKIKQKINEQVK